jgi:hypothetical protein
VRFHAASSYSKKSHRRKKGSKVSRGYRSEAAAEYRRALEKNLFGSQGAASPVRKIDPATGKVVSFFYFLEYSHPAFFLIEAQRFSQRFLLSASPHT